MFNKKSLQTAKKIGTYSQNFNASFMQYDTCPQETTLNFLNIQKFLLTIFILFDILFKIRGEEDEKEQQ